MIDNKKIKEELRKKAFKNPEKYAPIEALKELGYIINKCNKCHRIFFAVKKSNVCGDPLCYGGFNFIGNTPAKNKLDYIQAWTKFSEILERKGYTPIKRYPVTSRWRNDTDFVQASIYDFQPYVVSGEIEPPANPLIVPQLCFRFNDIESIGLTGAHYSCFVMQGQHAFVNSKDYDKNKYFKDLHEWFIKGIGLPKEDIYVNLDSWAGGGNAGVSCEFFSRGLEIATQVYMQYEIVESYLKDLNIKVLDMGQGQERVSWFTQGTNMSYDTTFPTVMKYLYKVTGIKTNQELMKKFLPYSPYLNLDEIEDIEKVWREISSKIKYNVKDLKNEIMPLQALYSIAEHSRALLIAINDGALPSNISGGYNLRTLFRRMQNFIDEYQWSIDINKMLDEHARFLKPLYPELSKNMNEVIEVLDHERKKYFETKIKARNIIKQIVKKDISTESLVQLYDSQGINPELIKEEASKIGKHVIITKNFFKLVAERHEKKQQATATKREEILDLKDLQATEILYYNDYKVLDFNATVIKSTGNNIILDRTAFYPTSGGQIHDLGKLNENEVINVYKQGNVVVHVLKDNKLRKNDKVHGLIDFNRRKQLAQHHTATHILNGACKKILGNHIWQHSAAKFVDKARLDITHYENLTQEQISKIERLANNIIKKGIKVNKFFLKRNEAEKMYGFTIYQGGAVPGRDIRIVEISGFDVEACGGTHLNNTKEVEQIKIIKTNKIQDGIVRLEFIAGKIVREELEKEKEILTYLASLLNCKVEQIPGRAEELFEKWKNKVKKGKQISIELKSTKISHGTIILETSKILKTKPEHLVNTIKKFLDKLKNN